MNIEPHTPTHPPHTTFLYPTSRKYPFDEVCEKIVRALEKRNWKVPGIDVRFYDTGTGELKYRSVSTIEGEDFKLLFCRIQGRLDEWTNNTAAISHMVIPRKELHVFKDESGPTFYNYAGENWEKDKDKFMNELKYNSKRFRKQKTYLRYSGSCGPLDENGYSSRVYKVNLRNPYLVNDDDSGNDYRACGEEPRYFHTDAVFQEFNDWLTVNALEKIESVEEATELTTDPGIPYPEHLGPLYVKIDWPTYDRILKGKEDKDQLPPSKRYALIGGEIKQDMYDFSSDCFIPEEAYRNFIYCSLTKPNLAVERDFCAVLSVKLKDANDIIIADNAVGDRYKRLWAENNPNNSRLTDAEYDSYLILSKRTFIPIHQYTGNYEKPAVLIKNSREVSFNEVEVIDVEKIPEDMKRYIIILEKAVEHQKMSTIFCYPRSSREWEHHPTGEDPSSQNSSNVKRLWRFCRKNFFLGL